MNIVVVVSLDMNIVVVVADVVVDDSLGLNVVVVVVPLDLNVVVVIAVAVVGVDVVDVVDVVIIGVNTDQCNFQSCPGFDLQYLFYC